MPIGVTWPEGKRAGQAPWKLVIGLVLLSAAGPPIAAPSARADNLTAQFKGTETFQYDDNPLLTTTNIRAATGSVTSPEATINDDTPDAHLDLDTRSDLNAFNRPGFSSVDLHSQFHSLYKGEIAQFGLNGGVDYDTTRTSELTASGINVAGIRHTGLLLAPQATTAITPIDVVVFNATFNQSTYGNTVIYTNYDNLALSPTYQHQFSPLDTGLLTLQATRYWTASGPAVSIETVGPLVGWQRNFSQSLSLTANVGFERSDTSAPIIAPGTSPVTWDYTYNLDLQFRGLQDTLHLTSSRSPSPLGTGNEALLTSFGLTESHNVTPRTVAEFALQYQTSSYSQTTAGVATDYLSANPRLRYHLTDKWDVVAEYRYRRQDTSGGTVAATSNAVLFDLVYTSQLLGF